MERATADLHENYIRLVTIYSHSISQVYLTPEEAESLANQLLSLAQELRERMEKCSTEQLEEYGK